MRTSARDGEEEALYQTGINPRTPAAGLDDESSERLYRTLGEVVETAIESRIEPEEWPEDWILLYRDEGTECPRCSGAIERIEVSGRGTYLCPSCQPRE